MTNPNTAPLSEATGIWPDFIAPPQYENPSPAWVDPRLPDFRVIWAVGRECGYGIGLHGSMKRDCDLIAVPWRHDADSPAELIAALCKTLNAREAGIREPKPAGRIALNIQVDGFVKLVDLSIVDPRVEGREAVAPQVEVTDAVVNYLIQYGGFCRDCADENGLCPSTGIGCGEKNRAVRHVLEGLNYGLKHGFLPPSALAHPAPASPAGTDAKDEQATNCAVCGEHKSTPLRIAAMGGYVCLACVEAQLAAVVSTMTADTGDK